MLDTLRNVETETQLKSMGVQIWKNNNKSNPESLHKLLLNGNFFNRKFSHVNLSKSAKSISRLVKELGAGEVASMKVGSKRHVQTAGS